MVVRRYEYDFNATLGVLTFGDFECYTLELPWYNNAEDISCIPAGVYPASIRKSTHNNSKLGHRVIWLDDVPGRSCVQIHIANRPTELRGCIAVGERIDAKQPAVLSSLKAMRALLNAVDAVGDKSFNVEIISTPGQIPKLNTL